MAWLGNYLFRKPLVIPHTYVDADVTDFVLTVSISDASIGAVVRGDGHDIVFTTADGTSLLTFLRRSFSVVGGVAQGVFHVKTNASSTSDTTIYMYYGYSLAADTSSTTTLNSFIYKLPLDSNYQDVTANAIHGTNNGTTLVSGILGNAANFSGASYIQTVHNESLNINGSNPFTISGWFKTTYVPPDSQMGHCIAQDGYDTSPYGKGLGITSDGYAIFYCYTGTTLKRVIGNTVLNDNGWHFLTGVFTGTQGKIYVDGVLQNTMNFTTTQSITNPVLVMGFKYGTNYPSKFYNFVGQTDEMSMSNAARTPAWVKLEYNNINGNLPISPPILPVFGQSEQLTLSAINKTVATVWNVYTVINQTQSCKWNVLSFVNQTSTIKWHSLESLNKSIIGLWNVFQTTPVDIIPVTATICQAIDRETVITQRKEFSTDITQSLQFEV